MNVDNDTLTRLLANEQAMQALMNIEGFRNLNTEIETIINLTEKVKKAKTKEEEPSDKEYKSMRKMIQEKLIKFSTRIPIFMYLSEFREYRLNDVRGIHSGERCFGTRLVKLRVHNQNALKGETPHVVNTAQYF